jgi:hypothetical protein
MAAVLFTFELILPLQTPPRKRPSWKTFNDFFNN